MHLLNTVGALRFVGLRAEGWWKVCRRTHFEPTMARLRSNVPPRSQSLIGARRSCRILGSSRWFIVRAETMPRFLACSLARQFVSMTGTQPTQMRGYRAVAFMRPHFQLDELTASLRLVAELPQSAR